MSGFLDRMAARATGTEQRLTLRRPSRFEPELDPTRPAPPQGDDHGDADRHARRVGHQLHDHRDPAVVDQTPEAVEEPPAVRATPAATPPAAAETVPPKPPTSLVVGDVPAAPRAVAEAPKPSTRPTRPVVVDGPSAPRPVPEPAVRRPSPRPPAPRPAAAPTAPASAHEPAHDLVHDPVPVPVPEPAELVREHVVPVLVDRGAITRTETVVVESARPSAPPAGRTVVVPGPTRTEIQDDAAPRERTTRPEVHVHIDRVEVLRPPAPPRPARTVRPARPTVDLRAYLARRKETR